METKGIILAGGQSVRMGQDKALISYKGISLLDHAKNILISLKISDITILGRPNTPDGIADYAPNEGPAINFCHWLQNHTPPFRLVVLPVDMPLLRKEQVDYLLSFENGAYFEDLYLPFTAFVTDSTFKPVPRMKTLLKHLQVQSVCPQRKWLKNLKNMNNPDDLIALKTKN